ncbi:hypothetical protein CPLU01_08999 [Colletotrichum plurivorum]|uniref:Uncharacterized protein n=1 Tax=Colletotrichum plurivorum TaxID=2175906 RepID=A0A8H6K9S5_9PEZI|nr:hypothetical protein CPLU01_08999 [Colletotrichum plurivorum]
MTATQVPPAAQQQRNPTLRHNQPTIAVRREGEEIVTRVNGWAAPFIRPFVRTFTRPGASDPGDVKITVGAVTVSVPLALAAQTGLVVKVDNRSRPATSRNLLADSWRSLSGLWRCVVKEVTFYKKHASRIDFLMHTLFSVSLAYTGWSLMGVFV